MPNLGDKVYIRSCGFWEEFKINYISHTKHLSRDGKTIENTVYSAVTVNGDERTFLPSDIGKRVFTERRIK